jgi:GAF domain-containing protein
VLALAISIAWYGARLRAALRDTQQEHLRAERNAQRLHLLLEATQRLMSITSADELLKVLTETTTRLLDAERATIFLVDAERSELWSKVALGQGAGDIRIPIGRGIAGAVAVSGRTIIIDEPYSDPRFNPEVDRRTGYVTRNLLTLPMLGADGRVVGVFQVLNKRSGRFTQEDAELLLPLAASAARAVEGTLKATDRRA